MGGLWFEREDLICGGEGDASVADKAEVEFHIYTKEGADGLHAGHITQPGGEPIIYESKRKELTEKESKEREEERKNNEGKKKNNKRKNNNKGKKTNKKAKKSKKN